MRTSNPNTGWWLVTALVMALLPAVAWGEAPKKRSAEEQQAIARAKKYDAEAEKLFNLGMFKEAAAAYGEAYKARKIPAFLYNIGQCHKRLGGIEHLEKALFYFESFGRTGGLAIETKIKLDGEIAKLRLEVKRLKQAKQERERPASTPVYKRWWFWTLVGAAVAGATVGTIVALQPEDQQPVPSNLTPDFIHLK